MLEVKAAKASAAARLIPLTAITVVAKELSGGEAAELVVYARQNAINPAKSPADILDSSFRTGYAIANAI